MKRTAPALCVTAALLMTGCTDLGLPGNIPEEESRTMPPPELVAQVIPTAREATAPLIVDGRLWVPTGRPFTPTAGQMRPIGSAAGHAVYARSWDERPYGAIFTRVETPSPAEATTARDAMAFGQEQWQAYAPAIGRTGQAATPGRLHEDATGGAPATLGGEPAPVGGEPADTAAPEPDGR